VNSLVNFTISVEATSTAKESEGILTPYVGETQPRIGKTGPSP